MDNANRCRLIGYTRVSTKQQGESNNGIEAQEAKIAAYTASSGCELVKTYREIESGRKNDRPRLKLAMDHAKRIRATLVIAEITRLARNVHFVSGLMESGVDFVACDMPQANRMTIHILAAIAEGAAVYTSEKTKDGLKALKERNLWSNKLQRYVTLGAPHHLTKEGGKKGSRKGGATIRRQKVEAYAYIAPTIAELKAQGMTLYAIAKHLNDVGEETRNGKKWTAMQVRRVLLMEASASERQPFRVAA